MKQYEATYYNEETGRVIIISRGNIDYVKGTAQMSQLNPYQIRECPQTATDIRKMYKEFRKENSNKKPNRAVVKMHWEDEDNTEKGYQIDTVAITSSDKIQSDDMVLLFTVQSLKGLIELTEHNNGSDFIVDEVIEFYKK